MTQTPAASPKPFPRDDLWIWLDLEMTGLEPDQDQIIEIATLITDTDLNEIAVGPNLVIHAPQSVLDGMDEWCTLHHGQSGLTAQVQASKLSLAEAEAQTIAFLSQYVVPGTAPICGNSICQDRRFLWTQMPKLEAFCHYRMLDVTALKLLAKTWYPDAAKRVQKQKTHLALDDIRESVAELAVYRQWMMK